MRIVLVSKASETEGMHLSFVDMTGWRRRGLCGSLRSNESKTGPSQITSNESKTGPAIAKKI